MTRDVMSEIVTAGDEGGDECTARDLRAEVEAIEQQVAGMTAANAEAVRAGGAPPYPDWWLEGLVTAAAHCRARLAAEGGAVAGDGWEEPA